MPRRLIAILVAAPLMALVGCASPRSVYHLDYTQYPELPTAATSKVLRTIVTVIPCLRPMAIHGNYGGPGSEPAPPIDDIDEVFRRHDIAYVEGTTMADLLAADRLLVSRLKALGPASLTEKSRAFRNRALRFFQSKTSRWLGKPSEVRHGTRTPRTIIPGNREKAEAQWHWHGRNPDQVLARAPDVARK